MIIGTLGQLEGRTGRGGGRCSRAAGLSEPVVVTAGGVLVAHWSNTLLTQVPETSMAQSNRGIFIDLNPIGEKHC